MLYIRKHYATWMMFCILISILLSACGMGAPTAQPSVSAPDATVPASAGPEPLAIFEGADCPFDLPEGAIVECGYVVVPEDHGSPGESTIRLAVAVIKDQSEVHQSDPVILLAGGPGEKVVHNTLGLGQVLAPLYPHRDLIVFDQGFPNRRWSARDSWKPFSMF